MSSQLRIISWNTAHRVGRVDAQAHALLSHSPDLVALQEVTSNTVGVLTQTLKEGGLIHSVYSNPPSKPPSRSYGVFIASRFPIEPLTPFSIPWAEKALSVSVSGNDRALEFHTVHIPNGSGNQWTKIETLEGVYAGLAKHSQVPRLLCGDLNTPKLEFPTGEVITWAQEVSPDGTIRTLSRFRGGSGSRWDTGERQVLTGLAEFGIRDVYRSLHGYGVPEFSWVLNRKGKSVRRRFDHIFASLLPVECIYLHPWREAKLSDHSPIEVLLSMHSSQQGTAAEHPAR